MASNKLKGLDDLWKLEYEATTTLGARSLLTSFLKGLSVRVFRSYKLKKYGCSEAGKYRFDGCYKIVGVEDSETRQPVEISKQKLMKGIAYTFVLCCEELKDKSIQFLHTKMRIAIEEENEGIQEVALYTIKDQSQQHPLDKNH
jgi:hypothetical protein